MELTREYLEERRADLASQYERSLADMNAASGGIQVIDVLLGKLAEEEPTEGEGE